MKYIIIEMSSQLLEISDVQDINSEKVFMSHEKIYGWLLFVNEDIFANWGHECRYIFYVNEEMFFEKHMFFPPSGKFVMEVV